VPWVSWIGLAVTAFPWAAVGMSWLTLRSTREPLGTWGDILTSLFFFGIPLTIVGLIKAGAWPRTDD